MVEQGPPRVPNIFKQVQVGCKFTFRAELIGMGRGKPERYYDGAMGCETPEKAINMFRQMMKEMELNNPVAVNKNEELMVLSTSVNPVRLKNNPVEINKEQSFVLYNSIVF